LLIGAIAAELLVGVFVGRSFDSQPTPWLRSGPEAKILADGAPHKGFPETLPGRQGPCGSACRSIRRRACATFSTGSGSTGSGSTGSGLSGMGCRQGSDWVVPIVVTGAAAGSGGDYRLAAGDVAPAVMAEVDRRIVGDPLGAAEEQALRQKGWKN
jgi:hypothetical protein